MTKVIGVRFRNAGKIYYFSPGKYEIAAGQHVIVETARGIEYGYVVLGTREVEDNKVVQPLKQVIRMANKEDEALEAANKKKEKDAFRVCQEKIRKHNLEMKLIDVEYTFDNNKILFYFTADGRIDFRELVKDLASVFKTRIELRQVGVRDETKIMGGVGICGRPLCCHTYLSDFRTGVHPDGQRTEPVPESHQDFRRLRPPDVLPEKRRGNLRVLKQQTAGRRRLCDHRRRTERRSAQRQRAAAAGEGRGYGGQG